MKNLYQPILFKKAKDSNWETGWKMRNDNGEFILEEDRKTKVAKIYKYKVNWF